MVVNINKNHKTHSGWRRRPRARVWGDRQGRHDLQKNDRDVQNTPVKNKYRNN